MKYSVPDGTKIGFPGRRFGCPLVDAPGPNLPKVELTPLTNDYVDDHPTGNVQSHGLTRESRGSSIDESMPQCIFVRYRPVCKAFRLEHYAPQEGREPINKSGVT